LDGSGLAIDYVDDTCVGTDSQTAGSYYAIPAEQETREQPPSETPRIEK
jgi:hypothetical protein